MLRSLLKTYNSDVSTCNVTIDDIISAFKNYNIDISMCDITVCISPNVHTFSFNPPKGISVSKFKSLSEDISLELAVKTRIYLNFNKGKISIEVPNVNPSTIGLKDVISDHKSELPLYLGLDMFNEKMSHDLTNMPHLLIGGATGQGKSVFINNIIISLLLNKLPIELELLLIDPKKVELSLYKSIKAYLKDDIITTSEGAISVLETLCHEMDKRYTLLMDNNVRNIKEYNNISNDKMKYTVVIIDEYADLKLTSGKRLEKSIIRLAQMGRAVGIHLIIATQRPSVDVISGIVKANFPTRISFKVNQKNDSRVILDVNGAEDLLGNGDMLLSNKSQITRIQSPYISTDEVLSICDKISETYKKEITDDGCILTDPLHIKAYNLHKSGYNVVPSMLVRKLNISLKKAYLVISELKDLNIII